MRDVTTTELELIAQDNVELHQLILGIRNNSAVGVIGLGFSPFMALFAEESFNYLRDLEQRSSGNTITNPLFDTFPEVVTKLRARIKLFDDNRGGVDGLINTLTLAHQRSSEWFSYPHRGFLRSLKRRLQPDLGIYYSEEHVIGTTHTALLTIGLTQDHLLAMGPADIGDLGTFAKEFSVTAGTYLGQLRTYLREQYNIEASPSRDLMDFKLPITNNDHHGHRVYAHISDRLELTQPELAMTIIFLVAQINFVERVLIHFLAPTSTFLLRARFLTSYHATRALQELVRLGGHPDVYRLGQLAQRLLNEPDANFLLNARQIRNVMAHYGLLRAAKFLSPEGDPLDDVLFGLCGRRRADVATISQRQLSRISEAFVEVISKTQLKDSRSLLGSHT